MNYVLFSKPLRLAVNPEGDFITDTYGFTFSQEDDLLRVYQYINYLCAAYMWEQHGNEMIGEDWIHQDGTVYCYYSPTVQEYAKHAREKLNLNAHIYKKENIEDCRLYRSFIIDEAIYNEILKNGINCGWSLGNNEI